MEVFKQTKGMPPTTKRQNMETQTITTRQAANHIRFSKGKIFTVEFIKRGDRKKNPHAPESALPLRKLTGRTGVSKGVNGTGRSYDAASHGLLTVAEFAPATRNDKGQFAGHEFTPGAFRNVGIEGIRSLKIGGKRFTVIAE